MKEEESLELKKFVSDRRLVTNRVLDWLKVMTKGDVCDVLEVSRPTLDKRIKHHNWNLVEIKRVLLKMPF